MKYEDIYARLKAGESSETIAQEMTAMLNSAITKVDEENKAAEEAKKATAAKYEDIMAIWDMFCVWAKTYESDKAYLMKLVNEEVQPEDIIDTIESTVVAIGKFDEVLNNCTKQMSSIEKFLKDNGLA